MSSDKHGRSSDATESSPRQGDAAPRGQAPAPERPGASSGGGGGLSEYLAAMSMLERGASRKGPTRLSAAEVRRHTTERMRAIDASDPPRRPTTGHVPLVADTRVGVTARRFVLPAVAVMLAIVIVAPRLFTRAPSAELPESIRGEWVTSHPSYAARRLIFTATAVGIAAGATQAPVFHAVSAVSVTPYGDTSRVVITYDEDGAPVEFPLQYSRYPQPRVVLANPPDVVWVPANQGITPETLPEPIDSVSPFPATPPAIAPSRATAASP